MAKCFVVVFEATRDFVLATELADRVMTSEIAWLDESLLESQREWRCEIPAGWPLTWKSVARRARDAGLSIHGHFDGQPGLPDARAAWRAVAYVQRCCEEVDGVVLIRDMDDQAERLDGLKQARALYRGDPPIVIGVANSERESWVICGFDPSDDNERELLAEQRQTLGWNPCEYSHLLTACKDDQAQRSPKRVLRALTSDNENREKPCWSQTPLHVLAARGARNGLAEFLEEVKAILVPILC